MSERDKRYTPGPWHLVRGHKTGTPRTVKPVLRWDSLIRSQNYEANANLIAAAPELLEALEKMRDVLEPASTDFSDKEQEAMDKTYSAIAKAYGEQG